MLALFFPLNQMFEKKKKSFCYRQTLEAFFLKENKYLEHFLTLCPELLHPTTSRAMGIHFEACIAVTKVFFTKSS